jgi:heat shock protein HslJ
MNRPLKIAIVAVVVLAAVLLVMAYWRGQSTTPPPAATQVPPATAEPTPAPPTSLPQPTANPIQDILWQWTSLTNRTTNETTSVSNPENYTISFFADSTLVGKADCNTFTGTYSQENGFSIKLGATTAMYCGDASLDQQYLQLLGSVAAGGPDGQGNLALETAGGEQRMEFKNGGAATK